MIAHGIYSVAEGDGPPVVIVHGLGFDHRSWDALAVTLQANHRVIRIDVRGHGRSDVRDGRYSLESLATDVVAVLDTQGVNKADFVGLSLGGMIGQALALNAPDRLNRLVLTCTTSGYGPTGPALWQARIDAVKAGGMAAIVDTAMQRFFSEPFRAIRPDVVNAHREIFLQTSPQGYVGCCHAIQALDFTDRLSMITAPTLVMSGQLDAGTPPEMGRLIAEKIPSASYIEIPGAGHLASAEQPEIFNAHVAQFLHRSR